MDYLDDLADAIRHMHKCKATHVQTVPIVEIFRGKVAWEGDVEVFEITGHPKAKRCYGWGYPNEKRGGRHDFVAVLEIPPVDSPQMAVRAAIMASR